MSACVVCVYMHARAESERKICRNVCACCVRFMRAYNNPKSIREREKEPVKELNKREERKKRKNVDMWVVIYIKVYNII